MKTLVIGDDFVRKCQLTDGNTGLAWDVSGATEIKATVISEDLKTQYCAEVVASSVASGADWSAGIVVVDIPSATTSSIGDHVNKKTIGLLSIQVVMGGDKTTARDSIRIEPGFIS